LLFLESLKLRDKRARAAGVQTELFPPGSLT
jgi:hypothetical protein